MSEDKKPISAWKVVTTIPQKLEETLNGISKEGYQVFAIHLLPSINPPGAAKPVSILVVCFDPMQFMKNIQAAQASNLQENLQAAAAAAYGNMNPGGIPGVK